MFMQTQVQQSGHSWLPFSTGRPLPPNPCYVGNDSDGSPMYIGRVKHCGDILPAKVIPTKNIAYVSHGGREIPNHSFEILTGSGFQWVPSNNGNVPPNALTGCKTASNEVLYIGRANHQGSLTPGKIQRSHNCMYFPFGGSEHSTRQYEVLTISAPRSRWMPTNASAGAPVGAHMAGNDSDGSPIYIGRATHGGDQLVAKVLPSKRAAYVCYNGNEVLVHQYEILCHGNVSWVPSANGHIPPNAVPGGRTKTGETLFIGRARHQGSLTVGKVQPSHNTLYIPYGGKEVAVKSYEVLIEN